ncbi:hypothetical protein, partial [Pseudomonas corrugata]|uniref:hypothetical protein n=1 Tax=Pseudomonas corrugata TaxID=47879 RepID=UPI001F518B7B
MLLIGKEKSSFWMVGGVFKRSWASLKHLLPLHTSKDHAAKNDCASEPARDGGQSFNIYVRLSFAFASWLASTR